VRVLDKFLALLAEKQNKIIDAALAAFGANGVFGKLNFHSLATNFLIVA